jgi:hypothetical protein
MEVMLKVTVGALRSKKKKGIQEIARDFRDLRMPSSIPQWKAFSFFPQNTKQGKQSTKTRADGRKEAI